MKSLKELYRIGIGPSSSHTMGPRKAAEIFLAKHPEAKSFEVTLYGSLAATGKGHMTDVAILDTLEPHAPTKIIWQPHFFLPFHPNGMMFKSKDKNGKVIEPFEPKKNILKIPRLLKMKKQLKEFGELLETKYYGYDINGHRGVAEGRYEGFACTPEREPVSGTNPNLKDLSLPFNEFCKKNKVELICYNFKGASIPTEDIIRQALKLMS